MQDTFFDTTSEHSTHMHPLGVLAIILLGIALLSVSRRYAIVPMLIMCCAIPTSQQVVIATLSFDLLRIMILFGTVRLVLRGEFGGIRWQTIDFVMIAWAIMRTVVFTIRWGTLLALKNRLGSSYDALGLYFLFRFLIRDWIDFDRTVTGIVVVSVPVAVMFAIELATRHNAFSILGGVPAETLVREGRLRCQGPFETPINAGCFWAALMPLIAVEWWRHRRKWAVIAIGLLCSIFVIFACSSSTPIAGLVAGMVAAAFFPFRRRMYLVRWILCALLVFIQLISAHPIWHLLVHVDFAGGSTGWHRYHLIDECITHVSEWWLIGIQSTEQWGWGLQDVTNQFLLEGVRGGLISMVLFIVIVVLAFGLVGQSVRGYAGNRRLEISAWALGVALFIHCANFIGIAYFGQISVVWNLTLAFIVSLSPQGRITTRKTQPVRQPRKSPRAVIAIESNDQGLNVHEFITT